jgi:hypothetical protein
VSVGACATQSDNPVSPSVRSASDAAFTGSTAAEPTPLPSLQPTSRPQRQIEAMSAADLAGWILPAEAPGIAAAELFPARWGVLTSAYLWQAPRPAGPAGVCGIVGWGVGFRIENENSLSDTQRLDPPLRPVFTVPERRFRVVGSTLSGGVPRACRVGQPYWGWSEAPSAEVLHRAARLTEQAQRNPGPLRLTCRQMRIDERTGDMSEADCADARGILRRLTPDLIKRVMSTPCEGDLTRFAEGQCIAVEYHDPDASGTHSLYMVRIAGAERPAAIDIVQGMLPPH